MTLPLIYTLKNSDKSTQRQLLNIVKNHNTNPSKVKSLLDTVVSSGGIEYAMKKMEEFRDKALQILHTFPPNEARLSLEKLVHYTIDREK